MPHIFFRYDFSPLRFFPPLVYLLGRCQSNQEAQRRKENLMEEFGLSDDMIRIHPDNGGDIDTYGVTVLGSHLGTTA